MFLLDQYELNQAMAETGVKEVDVEVFVAQSPGMMCNFLSLCLQLAMGKPAEIEALELEDGNLKLIRKDRNGEKAFDQQSRNTLYKTEYWGEEDGACVLLHVGYLWSNNDKNKAYHHCEKAFPIIQNMEEKGGEN